MRLILEGSKRYLQFDYTKVVPACTMQIRREYDAYGSRKFNVVDNMHCHWWDTSIKSMHEQLFGKEEALLLEEYMQRNKHRFIHTYRQVTTTPAAMREAFIGSPSPARNPSPRLASPVAGFGLAVTPPSDRRTAGGSSGLQRRLSAGGSGGAAAAGGQGGGISAGVGPGRASGSSRGGSPGAGVGRVGAQANGGRGGASAGVGQGSAGVGGRGVSAAAAAAAGQDEAAEAYPDLFDPSAQQRTKRTKRRR